ncbi:hypothetical protein SAY87_007951 [Trapa incisa]|uniref:Uncharacterized protein n=1 Tax=Trapa incisa TaxID=236973 RepID=A0AAN7QFV0_9MYRT|nr:hypothetical protein SAY87_007951 [Trapa incisa]
MCQLGLGTVCGCGLVKAFQKAYYQQYGNTQADGCKKGVGLGAEIIGSFFLVYTSSPSGPSPIRPEYNRIQLVLRSCLWNQ